MPSTFTKNNGIEKPGDGEQAGIWGQTVSRNFDILDQSLEGKHVLTLSTTGTTTNPNLLTIPYGLLSDNRKRIIEIRTAVTLGGAIYVRLDPDNAEKLYYVMNRTSGGRDVIFFQGTYAAARAATVRGGRDAIIHFDGGGSTATVTELLANFVPYVIDIDKDVAASFGGSTITYTSSNNRLVIDANGAGGFELRGSAPGAVSWIGGSTIIGSVDRSEAYARFYNNGAVQLLYDNQLKLETRTGGVSVTGDLSASVSLTANTINARTDGTARITGTGVGHLDLYSTNNNVRALAAIGSGFIVQELDAAGTPSATSKVIMDAKANGVRLYHDNVQKLITTANGVNIAGDVNASNIIASDGSFSGDVSITGNAGVDGIVTIGPSAAITIKKTALANEIMFAVNDVHLTSQSQSAFSIGSHYVNGRYISAAPNGVKLFYQNASKIETEGVGAKVIGRLAATDYIEAGGTSGGVAMTVNDGYGNASLTFNHTNGIPAQDGQAGRIVVNTNGAIGVDPYMQFQIAKDVTGGVAVAASPILTLYHNRIKYHYGIDQSSYILPSVAEALQGSVNDKVMTPARVRNARQGTTQTITLPTGVSFYDISTNHPDPIEAYVILENVTRNSSSGYYAMQLIVNGTVVTSGYVGQVMDTGSNGTVSSSSAPVTTNGALEIDVVAIIRKLGATQYFLIDGGGIANNNGCRSFSHRLKSPTTGGFTGIRILITNGNFTGGKVIVNWT